MALKDIGVFSVEEKLRPCYVEGEKALFHRWADRAETHGASLAQGGFPAGQYWQVFGIVEFESGLVGCIPINEIRFLDTQGYMNGIAWPKPEEE